MYSIALGPRYFKWKMPSLSTISTGSITRHAVNVRAISNGFLLVSFVTTLEEVCLLSFEVLYCWLNLVASCLDHKNEILLKVIASFSALRFALPSIPLIVLHSLVRSVFWSMVSTKSLHFFPIFLPRYGFGCLYSILAVHVRWGLFYGGYLVCSSRPVSLLVQVPHGDCDVQ